MLSIYSFLLPSFFLVVPPVTRLSVVEKDAVYKNIDEQWTVSCTSVGYPRPTITWRLNNMSLPAHVSRQEAAGGGDYLVEEAYSYLSIERLTAQDSGIFECTGEINRLGTSRRSRQRVELRVLGMLIVTHCPLTQIF